MDEVANATCDYESWQVKYGVCNQKIRRERARNEANAKKPLWQGWFVEHRLLRVVQQQNFELIAHIILAESAPFTRLVAHSILARHSINRQKYVIWRKLSLIRWLLLLRPAGDTEAVLQSSSQTYTIAAADPTEESAHCQGIWIANAEGKAGRVQEKLHE